MSLAPLSASNSGLDYLRGTLGRSYMCREEQTLSVDQNFSLNTYQLQVQPFGVSSDQFGEGQSFSLFRNKRLGFWLCRVYSHPWC